MNSAKPFHIASSNYMCIHIVKNMEKITCEKYVCKYKQTYVESLFVDSLSWRVNPKCIQTYTRG